MVMGSANENQFRSADRALIVISDATIHGSTRLQKYGFLLYKQYGKELSKISGNESALKFYEDWKAFWYGPFSKSLMEDIDECVTRNLCIKKKSIYS